VARQRCLVVATIVINVVLQNRQVVRPHPKINSSKELPRRIQYIKDINVLQQDKHHINPNLGHFLLGNFKKTRMYPLSLLSPKPKCMESLRTQTGNKR